MFVTNQLHAGKDNEPIQHRNIISIPKLLIEGTPDKCQIVLGWLLNTHHLLVRLPDDKFWAWLEDVTTTLCCHGCTQDNLDTG
jgi:hypothetical protein